MKKIFYALLAFTLGAACCACNEMYNKYNTNLVAGTGFEPVTFGL